MTAVAKARTATAWENVTALYAARQTTHAGPNHDLLGLAERGGRPRRGGIQRDDTMTSPAVVAKVKTATASADVSVSNQDGGAPESGGGTPEETWNDPGWRRRPGSQQWRRRYSQSGHPTADQHERPWWRPFCGPRRRRGRAGRQGDGGGKDRQTGDQEQHCGGNPLLNSGFLHGGAVWAVR